MADQVAQTSKNAIDASQHDTDLITKVFSIFIGAFTLIGIISAWIGFKSFSESREKMERDFSESREKIEKTFIARLDELSEKATNQIKDHMDGMTAGTFLENFLSTARGQFIFAEQIEILLKNQAFMIVLPQHEEARLNASFKKALAEAKSQLLLALPHIDMVNKDLLDTIAPPYRVLPRDQNISESIFLKTRIYTLLGWLSKRQGLLSEAIDYAKRANYLHSNDPDPVYNLACYYSLQGDIEKGFEYLEKALEIDPASRKTLRENPDRDLDHLMKANRPRYETLVS